MNQLSTSPPALALVRRASGIELPAAGRWRLHRASFVGLTVDRRRHVRPQLLETELVVGADELDPIRIDIRTDDARMTRLSAFGASIGADTSGFGRWTLGGAIVDDAHEARAIDGELRFHGVFRRGSEAWGWLSGHANTRRQRRRSGLEVVFDLIAIPEHAPWEELP